MWVGIGLLVLTSVLGSSTAGWADTEPVERHARFRYSQTYYLHVPTGYTSGRAWPLFICVHGAMASGKGDFLIWKQYADAEGFILLSPNFDGLSDQYHLLEGGVDRILLALIDEVSEEHRVDRAKILLSGFSRGGQFAYRFAMRYPDRVHTVVVLNAGDLPTPAPAMGGRRPRFYLAAGSEEAVYPQQLPSLAERLRRAGYPAEVYIAHGIGHSIPPRAIVDVVELFRAMRDAGPKK